MEDMALMKKKSMTKKQFREALRRGQGRCLQAVQTDPDRYVHEVLWACGRMLAFDPQCEGTRSEFVLQLVNCYPDRTPFLNAALEAWEHTPPGNLWQTRFILEFLHYYSADGDERATRALWCNYERQLACLLAKKRPSRAFTLALEDFAQLCVLLAQNKKHFLRIAEDIGRLYHEKRFADATQFLWLYQSRGKRWLAALKEASRTSEQIASYLRVSRQCEREDEEQRENRQCEPKKGVSLSRALKRADEHTVWSYAEKYLAQTDPEARAEALSAFFVCPWPGDPLPLIEDARSGNTALYQAAWRALEKVRHPMVRQLALEHFPHDATAALPVFIRNYREEDAHLLESLVKRATADKIDPNKLHALHLDVLNMELDGLKAPPSLLTHIYETTRCSLCREDALKQMGRQRMLTDEILQECSLDCNPKTRSYAKRCLQRRAKKQEPKATRRENRRSALPGSEALRNAEC